MSAKLLVIVGPDRGESFDLEAGTQLTIGRSQSTHTKLKDGSISRLHCQVEYDGRKATLLNVSGKGTLVNGKPCTQQELRHGDVIRVGGTELRFALLELAEAETLVQPGDSGQSPPAAGAQTLVGKRLGHYQLESIVAKGQTGVVFQATDARDDSQLTLKVLQPQFVVDDDSVQRFTRAMKTVFPLQHPNIVRVFNAGRTGAYCWVAMERIAGESMAEVIKRAGVAGMLDWRTAFRVAVHIGRALQYAHGQGIVHRSVTPNNLLWRPADKTALLGDLMYAKALEGSLAYDVTKPGELLGEVAYLAPERTHGMDLDARADLYGLGATVYALLTGKPPCTGQTLAEVIVNIRTKEPEKPRKVQMAVPEPVQGVVMTLLAKRPEDRHDSATELLKDLERVGKIVGWTE